MSNDLKKLLAISIGNALLIYLVNSYFNKKEAEKQLTNNDTDNGN